MPPTEDEIRIEHFPLSEIRKWPRNPKEHATDDLAESIRRFGFVDPLIVDTRTGMLVSGHGRLETLEKLKAAGEPPPKRIGLDDDTGEWTVPVLLGIEFNSDSEAEAFGLAVNQLCIAGGYDDAKLAELLVVHRQGRGLTGTGFKPADVDDVLHRLNAHKPAGPLALEPAPEEEAKPQGLGAAAGTGETEAAEEVSHVRMIQMVMSGADYKPFEGQVQQLMPVYTRDNLSDAVIEAVRRQAAEHGIAA